MLWVPWRRQPYPSKLRCLRCMMSLTLSRQDLARRRAATSTKQPLGCPLPKAGSCRRRHVRMTERPDDRLTATPDPQTSPNGCCEAIVLKSNALPRANAAVLVSIT